MAKSLLKLKAQELRKQGLSIGSITKQLDVAKSSVSLWCKDIPLSPDQIDKLLANKLEGGVKGRFKGVEALKNRKNAEINQLMEEGIKKFKFLSKQQLLFVGLGIYWGEGYKSIGRTKFGITNSDPKLVKFIIRWFTEALEIPKEDLVFRVQINEICRDNIDKVEDFWYKLTGATESQFRRPTYIQTPNKKSYANQDEHKGNLIIVVRRGTYRLRKVLGLIEGLSESKSLAV